MGRAKSGHDTRLPRGAWRSRVVGLLRLQRSSGSPREAASTCWVRGRFLPQTKSGRAALRHACKPQCPQTPQAGSARTCHILVSAAPSPPRFALGSLNQRRLCQPWKEQENRRQEQGPRSLWDAPTRVLLLLQPACSTPEPQSPLLRICMGRPCPPDILEPQQGAVTHGGHMGSEPVSGSGFQLSDTLLCWEDIVRGVIPYGRCDRLHSLETLKEQQFILPQSGGQKSEVQVWLRGRVPGPLQPRGRRLQPPDLSHCPHLAVLTAQLLISPQSRVPRFTLITAARPCFQIRSQSQAPGAQPSS